MTSYAASPRPSGPTLIVLPPAILPLHLLFPLSASLRALLSDPLHLPSLSQASGLTFCCQAPGAQSSWPSITYVGRGDQLWGTRTAINRAG